MPCTYYETPQEIAARAKETRDAYVAKQTARIRETLSEREAMLCAILTLLSKAMTEEELAQAIAKIDAKEAGVSPLQILLWWHKHKNKDQKRREKEKK